MEKQIRKSAVDLTDLAVGIIVLGIVVAIGSTVLLGVRDARLTSLTVVTTSNESATPTTTGEYHLTNTWGKAVTEVYNKTVCCTHVSDYTTTIDGVTGQMYISNTTDTLGAQDLNISYTWYNTSIVDWKVANQAATGLAEYGNWFKIIVIVGVAAVILSLIFMAFGRGREAGGSY